MSLSIRKSMLPEVSMTRTMSVFWVTVSLWEPLRPVTSRDSV